MGLRHMGCWSTSWPRCAYGNGWQRPDRRSRIRRANPPPVPPCAGSSSVLRGSTRSTSHSLTGRARPKPCDWTCCIASSYSCWDPPMNTAIWHVNKLRNEAQRKYEDRTKHSCGIWDGRRWGALVLHPSVSAARGSLAWITHGEEERAVRRRLSGSAGWPLVTCRRKSTGSSRAQPPPM
jgi:hypothetical protein